MQQAAGEFDGDTNAAVLGAAYASLEVDRAAMVTLESEPTSSGTLFFPVNPIQKGRRDIREKDLVVSADISGVRPSSTVAVIANLAGLRPPRGKARSLPPESNGTGSMAELYARLRVAAARSVISFQGIAAGTYTEDLGKSEQGINIMVRGTTTIRVGIDDFDKNTRFPPGSIVYADVPRTLYNHAQRNVGGTPGTAYVVEPRLEHEYHQLMHGDLVAHMRALLSNNAALKLGWQTLMGGTQREQASRWMSIAYTFAHASLVMGFAFVRQLFAETAAEWKVTAPKMTPAISDDDWVVARMNDLGLIRLDTPVTPENMAVATSLCSAMFFAHDNNAAQCAVVRTSAPNPMTDPHNAFSAHANAFEKQLAAYAAFHNQKERNRIGRVTKDIGNGNINVVLDPSFATL
jgi:hypothetical protein